MLDILGNMDEFVRFLDPRRHRGYGVSLYGVVALDLRRHHALAQRLANEFSSLSDETGKHFVFFAPRVGVQSAALDRQAAESAMIAAATLLGLPPIDRPFIFITEDLRRREGFYLETSDAQVRAHLLGVARIAEEMVRSVNPPGVGLSLARLAAATRAAAGETISDSAEVMRFGLAAASGANLEPLEDSLLSASGPEVSELKPDTRYALSMLHQVGSAAPGAVRLQAAVRPEDAMSPMSRPVLVESLTKHYLERGDMQYGATLEHFARRDPRFDRFADLREDYAPAVHSWSEAVEFELAASVGHLVRALVGVHLPEYYGLHQNKPRIAGAAVDPGGGRPLIGFNMKARRSLAGTGRCLWRPPAMGEMRVAVETVHGQRAWERGGPWASELERVLGPPDVVGFIDDWRRINPARNDSAHAGTIFSRAEADEARAVIDRFFGSPVMKRLVDAKSAVKAQASG